MGLIFSFSPELVTTIISNGCKPDEEGAKWAASNIAFTLSCETDLPFIFLVAYRHFKAFNNSIFFYFENILKSTILFWPDGQLSGQRVHAGQHVSLILL